MPLLAIPVVGAIAAFICSAAGVDFDTCNGIFGGSLVVGFLAGMTGLACG